VQQEWIGLSSGALQAIDAGGERMTPMPELHQILTEAGFSIRYVSGELITCILEEHGSQWRASAITEENALEIAFRTAVPSSLVRNIFYSRVKRKDADLEPVVQSRKDAVHTQRPLFRLGAAIEDKDVDYLLTDVLESQNRCVSQLLNAPTTAVPGQDSTSPPERQAIRMKFLSQEDAIERIKSLKATFSDSEIEIAQHAQRNMKLFLLQAITDMRSVLDQVESSNNKLEVLSSSFAKQLGVFAKKYWPGEVQALKKDSSPWDCGAQFDLPMESSFGRWSQVHDAASSVLSEYDLDSRADDFGWYDSAALSPRPLDPAGRLQQINSRFNRLQNKWSERNQRPAPHQWDAATQDETLWLARNLRWIRGSVIDTECWCELMGKLRRIAQFSPKHASFRRVLEFDYLPAVGSWAGEIGEQPREKQQRDNRRNLIINKPGKDDDLNFHMTWLQQAFDRFDCPEEIAFLLKDSGRREFANQLRSSGKSRRQRRQFPKICSIWCGESSSEEISPEFRNEVDASDNYESGIAVVPIDPHIQLVKQVLPLVEGTRILYVGNREDPELKASLEKTLQPKLLDWSIKGKGMNDTVKTIETSSYDIVLCATGFIDHETDKRIRKATKKSGCTYVSVYKGRRTACLQGLKRDLARVPCHQ